MANDGTIKIGAELDDKQLSAGISKIGSAVATGLGAAVKSVGVAIGALTVAFGGLSIQALKLGGDLEQNLGGAEAVFGKFADTVKTKGETAFKDMGLSLSDFLATANKMGALFQGAGFGIEESADLSTKAMQRAADVASIMGIDMGSAMESIAGAAKGNFTMMDNLGVAMNATTIEAYALSKGIDKSYNSMTNQEKIGLAMEMFLEKTAYAAGNYAKENDTLAGSLTTAKAAWDNFLTGAGDVDSLVSAFSNAGEVISKNLIELLPRLATGLSEVMQGLMPLVPPLMQELLPAFVSGITMLFDGLMAAMPGLTQVLSGMIPMLLDAIITALPVLVNAGVQIMSALADGIIDAIPKIAPAAVQIIQSLLTGLMKVLPQLANGAVQIITSLSDELIKAMPVLLPAIVGIITEITRLFLENAPLLIETSVALLNGIADGIIASLPVLADSAPDIIKALGDALIAQAPLMLNPAGVIASAFTDDIRTQLEAKWPSIVDFLEKTISDMIENIKQWWNELPGSIGESVGQVLGVIYSFGSELFNYISENFPMFMDSIESYFAEMPDRIWKWLVDTLAKIKQWMNDLASSARTEIPRIVSEIVDYFSNLPDRLYSIGVDLVQGLWSGIQSMAGWLGSQISNFIDDIKSGFTSVTGFDINSPSKWARDIIGASIPEGIANGIKTHMIDVEKAINGSIGDLNVGGRYTPAVELQGIHEQIAAAVSARHEAAAARFTNYSTVNNNESHTAAPVNISVNIESPNISNDVDIDILASKISRKIANKATGNARLKGVFSY